MMGTILVGAVVLALVGGIVWRMVKNHRQGRGKTVGENIERTADANER